jgi:AcrR family transcriptional regulator
MASRREELLDAAILVLGQRGIHALSHRAVDAAAGLPAGSTSNHFRTRDALLAAVVERISARERANWEEIAVEVCPTTPQELAKTAALFAHEATGPQRSLTLARYAILVDAGIHPSIRAQLSLTGARVNAWFINWLRIAGSTDPERHAPIILNHWTGLVLHDLAIPDPAFDPYPQIAALVTAIVKRRAATTAAPRNRAASTAVRHDSQRKNRRASLKSQGEPR